MKAVIVVNIDEDSIRKSGLSKDYILETTLDQMQALYNRLHLVTDFGYNPQIITNGIEN